MSRKHFEAIAAGFKQTKPQVEKGRPSELLIRQWLRDVAAVAVVLKQLSPQFDTERFLIACNGELSARLNEGL